MRERACTDLCGGDQRWLSLPRQLSLASSWIHSRSSVEVAKTNVPSPRLMLELGHESLAVTQDYLADVRKPGEAKKAVSDADFIPKPRIVKTGTDGD